MDVQIPLYRAKKLDSNEYVEGLLYSEYNKYNSCEDYFICDEGTLSVEMNSTHIDEDTLAIHFSDMLAQDSDRLLPNGDKDLRIFASLSESGKGGDKIKAEKTITPVIYKDCRIKSRRLDCSLNSELLKGFDIVGIQK